MRKAKKSSFTQWLSAVSRGMPPEAEPAYLNSSLQWNDIDRSAVIRVEEYFARWYTQDGLIQPPYDFVELLQRVESDETLQQLAHVIATEVSQHGWDTSPRYDPSDTGATPQGAEPELDVIAAWKEFLEEVCEITDEFYNTTYDWESQGNGVLEVLPHGDGRPGTFAHARWYQFRLAQLSHWMLGNEPYINPRTGEVLEQQRWKRFRKFVQYDPSFTFAAAARRSQSISVILNGSRQTLRTGEPLAGGGQALCFFAEYGAFKDMNRFTGQWSDTPLPPQLRATQLKHFSHYCPHSPYGRPLWIGADGMIQAKINLLSLVGKWFNDGMIDGKLALLDERVVDPNVAARLKDKIRYDMRGIDNAFGIHFVSLMRMRQSQIDKAPTSHPAQFMDISSKLKIEDLEKAFPGMRKVVRAMRGLAPMYSGEAEEYNWASTRSAREVTEKLVFQPMRRKYGRFLARVYRDRGYIHYKPEMRDSRVGRDSDFVKDMAPLINEGVPSFNELKRVWYEQIDRPFTPHPDAWANLPWFVLQQRTEKQQALDAPVGEYPQETPDMVNDPGVIAESLATGDHLMDAAKALYADEFNRLIRDDLGLPDPSALLGGMGRKILQGAA